MGLRMVCELAARRLGVSGVDPRLRAEWLRMAGRA
jgi:hypothetical protein